MHGCMFAYGAANNTGFEGVLHGLKRRTKAPMSDDLVYHGPSASMHVPGCSVSHPGCMPSNHVTCVPSAMWPRT